MNSQPTLLKGSSIAMALLVLTTIGSAIADPSAPPPASSVGINSVIGSDDAYQVSHQGFWKTRMPTKYTKPFGNYDALELAHGKRVDSGNCYQLWADSAGDIFCFSSLAHRETFLRAYGDNVRNAVVFYRKGSKKSK